MIDPKKLAEYAKGKKGKKGLPDMIKGKYGQKGRGPDHEEEEEHEDDEHEGKKGRGRELSDEEIQAIGDRVQDGKGDKKLMQLVEGYDPEEDGNPPEWVADEAIWEKAKDAAEKDWDSWDEPWAVVATIYSSMGGSVMK